MDEELSEFIRKNEEERTQLMRENQQLLAGFAASFEEHFPQEITVDAAQVDREKRDWFAGQALAHVLIQAPMFRSEGMHGSPKRKEDFKRWSKLRAAEAYEIADAMLVERNK